MDGEQPLSTTEANTLGSERYRKGRDINDLLSFRTTPEAFIPKKNALQSCKNL